MVISLIPSNFLPEFPDFRFPKTVRKMPRARMPLGIELRYFRFLSKYSKNLIELTEEIFLPGLRIAIDESKEVIPSSDNINTRRDNYSDKITETLRKTTIAFNQEYPNSLIYGNANDVGVLTSDFQRNELQRLINSAIGVNVLLTEPWLNDVLFAFTENNVELIKTINQRHFNDLRQISFQGVAEGKSYQEIKSIIRKRYNTTEWNAERIARDQVLKLHSQLNQYRQTEIGVKSYFWRTMKDNRVRDSHRVREGKEYFWNKPPSGGHPGTEVLCRCFAEPNLRRLLKLQ